VALKLVDLAADQEEAFYTRYGVVSRVGYGLSPLAQGLVRQLIACDTEI
ncbi:TPA: LysR family transcriptional regulator, partial [Pseudomonas putida]|nr:LysR family transcriptional regulator [Pseudomonas putida]